MVQPKKTNLYLTRPGQDIYNYFQIHPRTTIGDRVCYRFFDEEAVHEASIASMEYAQEFVRWHLLHSNRYGRPSSLTFWKDGDLIYDTVDAEDQLTTRSVESWDYQRRHA